MTAYRQQRSKAAFARRATARAQLDGKTVIVTGAAGGIGQVVTLELMRRGAHVVGSDIVVDVPKALAGDAPGLPGRLSWFPADVRADDSVDDLVRQATRIDGRLSGLVALAAIPHSGSVETTSTEDWRSILDVNLLGCARLARSALPELRSGMGGSIVFVSSVHGLVGWPSSAAYDASKGGINALVHQMAVDYGPVGIRVNAIAPGAIMTPELDRQLSVYSMQERQVREGALARMVPLGRIGTPFDVAHAVGFLLADESSYITGHILVVDGGGTISGHLPR